MQMRLTRAGLAVGAAIVFFLVANRCASLICHHSDNAAIVLMGDEMSKGNWNLHGWTMPTDHLWTTYLPLFATYTAIRGIHPAAMNEIPALTFTVLIAAAVWLVRTQRSAPATVPGELFAFSILGLLAAPWVNRLIDLPANPCPCLGNQMTSFAWQALTGNCHGATLPLCLVAVGLLAPLVYPPRKSAGPLRPLRRLLLVTVVLGLILYGDPFAVPILFAPLVIVALAGIIRNGFSGAEGAVLASIAGALILMWALHVLVRATGGFTETVNFGTRIAPYSELPGNALAVSRFLILLFGGDFFGRAAAQPLTILSFIRFAALVFVVYCVISVVWKFMTGGDTDWISTVLAIGATADVAMCLFSESFDVPAQGHERFLVPAVIFGAVISGRTLSDLSPAFRREGWAALAVMVAASVVLSTTTWMRVQRTESPFAQLGNWLEQQGLHHGYGPYWDADIVTVETSGRVRMRAVKFAQGRVSPLDWLSSPKWYSEPGDGRTFLAWDEPAAKLEGLSLADAVTDWGKPAQVYNLGLFKVAVWDRDITW